LIIAILLAVVVLWQLLSGTLIIAPIRRQSDPASYWLVMVVESAVAAFAYFQHH